MPERPKGIHILDWVPEAYLVEILGFWRARESFNWELTADPMAMQSSVAADFFVILATIVQIDGPSLAGRRSGIVIVHFCDHSSIFSFQAPVIFCWSGRSRINNLQTRSQIRPGLY